MVAKARRSLGAKMVSGGIFLLECMKHIFQQRATTHYNESQGVSR